ncbi:MAG TPA: hypothetical protein VFC44_21150, partial [Candidatus Saccharimonadales bacterium]|nr:hypothetical protein [Candidatus Saccharimonadales bacterium]
MKRRPRMARMLVLLSLLAAGAVNAQSTQVCDGCSFSGNYTNVNLLSLAGPNASTLANQSAFFNQAVVQETSIAGLGFNAGGGGTTAFYNLAAGTYQFITNSSIYAFNCCGNEIFQNQGLVWKSAGTSNTAISVSFNNLAGTIKVDRGE